MRIRRLAFLVASTAALAPIGCATTSKAKPPQDDPPAPSLRYSTGRALQDFRFPSSVVQDAVVEALEDLKFTVTRRGQDGPATDVEARTPDRRTVFVTLRSQYPVTRVSCRIGWFGDEPLTRTVMRRVEVRLGTIPPEPIPDHLPSKPAPNPYLSRENIPDSEMVKDMVEAPYRNRPDF